MKIYLLRARRQKQASLHVLIYTLQHSQSILLYMGDGRPPTPTPQGGNPSCVIAALELLLDQAEVRLSWARILLDSATCPDPLLLPVHSYVVSGSASREETRIYLGWTPCRLYCSICEAQGLTSHLTSPTALPILKPQTFYQNLSLLSLVDLNFPLHSSSLFFCFQK